MTVSMWKPRSGKSKSACTPAQLHIQNRRPTSSRNRSKRIGTASCQKSCAQSEDVQTGQDRRWTHIVLPEGLEPCVHWIQVLEGLEVFHLTCAGAILKHKSIKGSIPPMPSSRGHLRYRSNSLVVRQLSVNSHGCPVNQQKTRTQGFTWGPADHVAGWDAAARRMATALKGAAAACPPSARGAAGCWCGSRLSGSVPDPQPQPPPLPSGKGEASEGYWPTAAQVAWLPWMSLCTWPCYGVYTMFQSLDTKWSCSLLGAKGIATHPGARARTHTQHT